MRQLVDDLFCVRDGVYYDEGNPAIPIADGLVAAAASFFDDEPVAYTASVRPAATSRPTASTASAKSTTPALSATSPSSRGTSKTRPFSSTTATTSPSLTSTTSSVTSLPDRSHFGGPYGLKEGQLGGS